MNIDRRNPSAFFEIDSVLRQLRNNAQISLKDMAFLIHKAQTIFKNQPNVLELTSPLTIVGDIHGQFYDLLNIFQKYGSPVSKQYLFLGDYVDRGTFSIEVITLLLVYKLLHPKAVHLLRGNHETRALTSTFNFRDQCLSKYNQAVYDQLMNLFDMLPIAAVIDKKYFAVHGGISPHCKTISQIQQLDRFKEVPQKGGLCDLLWSDPINDFCDKWKTNNIRQCSFYFGISQAKSFLNKNNLKMIIRGHQVEEEGFKYQKHMNTYLTLTVFSAPNYGDVYKNKGCIAEVNMNSVNIQTFSQVEHPIVLPNFQNAFQWSTPFIGDCLQHMFRMLLKFQSQKITNQINDIIKSEEKFKDNYEKAQTALFIDKILTLTEKQENCIEKEAKPKRNMSLIDPKHFSQVRLSFTVMKEKDDNEKMPEAKKAAGVIGPKLNVKDNKIKSIDLQEQNSIDSFSFN